MPTQRDLGRLGAALVTSALGLHLLMLHHMSAGPAALMVVMVALCAPCGVALWRGGSPLAWATTGVMAGLMLGVHHAWALHETAGHGTVLSALATAVASAEIALAVTALAVGHRRRPSAQRKVTGACRHGATVASGSAYSSGRSSVIARAESMRP
ncbi:hypothetical protein [Nocardioides sp. 616]|uniref:hypothetical protein n=1 Tax=Nocardioides sp. 616 TaxID=2268090 RepID=UPI0013B44AEF|nr:hypothetical protein [Nocardioides sp. 616]